MLRRCRPRAVIEDLEALAFGDRAPDVPQPAGDASSSPSAPALVAHTSAPTSPAAIVISDSPPAISLSAGDRERLTDVSREEGRLEKRPRIKASPSFQAQPSSSEVAPQSSWPALWRLDLEVDVGRPLNMEDRVASSPFVVAALGQALLVSTMRSAISVSLRQHFTEYLTLVYVF